MGKRAKKFPVKTTLKENLASSHRIDPRRNFDNDNAMRPGFTVALRGNKNRAPSGRAVIGADAIAC